MSYQAVMQFLESSSKDESLRAGLADVMGVGDGDISSAKELDGDEAQALLGDRGVRVAAFAEEKGFVFSLRDLNTVVSVFQRYRSGEMSDQDFAKAMGWDTSAETVSKNIDSVGKTVGLVYRGVKYSAGQEKSSANQVLDFMKKTSEDSGFREQLREILAVGDGDIGNFDEMDADEASALRSSRGVLVAEFAAKNGYMFTLSDLLAVTDAFERVQSGQFSNEEFEKFLNLKVNSRDFFPFISNVVSMTYKGVKYASPVVSQAKDNTLSVVRFIEQSGSDPDLRQKLTAVIGGDGDISSPGALDQEEAAALAGDRSNQIVAIGAEAGYRFTVSDLNAVLCAFQLVNAGKLSNESCARILGMGKSGGNSESVKKTAGLIYRGVRQ